MAQHKNTLVALEALAAHWHGAIKQAAALVLHSHIEDKRFVPGLANPCMSERNTGHVPGISCARASAGSTAEPRSATGRRIWHASPPRIPKLWHNTWVSLGLSSCSHPASHAARTAWQQNISTSAQANPASPSQQPAAGKQRTGQADASKGFIRGGFSVDMFTPDLIRNFCIIAHVDHGKSTLADRLMEMTGALVSGQAHRAQYLDKLQVERDRGITVKAQTVSLIFKHKDSHTYLINLIDTPGHVDFSYEVSRSLSACQGALLLVDAGQGVQAQTVANWRMASEQGLVIVPAVNKVDLPQADPAAVSAQLESVCCLDQDQVLRVSAKTGLGLEHVLPAIIERVPPPSGDPTSPLRLFLFDAYHDEFRGVVALVEVVDGCVSRGDRVASAATGEDWEVLELGVLAPERHPTDKLLCGQVGYVITGVKDLKAARVGDTWLHLNDTTSTPLPGFRPARPMMFAGLYPLVTSDFDALAVAMDRLTLNDASVVVRRENSDALGPGFRCGFLGMLHMEVFMQRLEQEHGTAVVTTTPTVPYLIDFGPGQEPLEISRATDLPIDQRIQAILEPTVRATIIAPVEYTGKIMQLCGDRRGELLEHIMLTGVGPSTTTPATSSKANKHPQSGSDSSSGDHTSTTSAGDGGVGGVVVGARCLVRYILPLSELAGNLYSELKSRTQGYASFDYEPGDYREASLQRLDILAHGKPVDALSRLVHKDEINVVGRSLIAKMKQLLDRQQFDVALQATANGRIIARETLKAMRKDVTAKCYGGDITRKRKLLDKQKEGKSRMKRLGSIDVPASAFPELMRSSLK